MYPVRAVLFDIGGVCVGFPPLGDQRRFMLMKKVASPFQAIFDYETEHCIPAGWVNFAIARAGADGAWARLERGAILLDDAFYTAFTADLCDPHAWAAFHGSWREPSSAPMTAGAKGQGAALSVTDTAPLLPLPSIDARALFHSMIATAATPDLYMLPALRRLRTYGAFVLGALSNTVPIPAGHPLSHVGSGNAQLRGLFDVFVASAEVGMRKPERAIYELAVRRLDEWDRVTGRGKGIRAEEVLFLDDIGANCKTAKEVGMKTIKVRLGRTREAVKEMEGVLGIDLGLEKGKL